MSASYDMSAYLDYSDIYSNHVQVSGLKEFQRQRRRGEQQGIQGKQRDSLHDSDWVQVRSVNLLPKLAKSIIKQRLVEATP